MHIIDWGLLLMGLALGTILGRIWEKWASGIGDVEAGAYKAGYNDGVDRLFGKNYMCDIPPADEPKEA